ncbi:MAG: hypothetical protein U0797_11455 [Gemmataceae bacterium]
MRFARRTMTWKGKHPLVELVGKSCCKGVKLTPEEMARLEKQNRAAAWPGEVVRHLPRAHPPWDSYFCGTA